MTNRITSEEKLFRCHFVHHESHIKSPEMNRSLRDEKPASNHLRQTRACTHTNLKNTTCRRLHLTLLSLRYVCRRSRVYSNYETDLKMVQTNSTGRYAIIGGIAKVRYLGVHKTSALGITADYKPPHSSFVFWIVCFCRKIKCYTCTMFPQPTVRSKTCR